MRKLLVVVAFGAVAAAQAQQPAQPGGGPMGPGMMMGMHQQMLGMMQQMDGMMQQHAPDGPPLVGFQRSTR